MLADFLESVQQPVNLILTLKLLLRFNNGVRENVDESLSGNVAIFIFLVACYITIVLINSPTVLLSPSTPSTDSVV